MKRQTKLRNGLLLASVLLFAVSLTQDGFYIDRTDRDAWASCFGLLLIGWLAVFDGVFAWLANPLLAWAWIFIVFGRSRLTALSFAAFALGFSLSFLMHGDILTNEAGGRSAITEYGWGYWLWITSILLAIAAAALVEKPAPPKTPEQIAAGDQELARRIGEHDGRK